MYFRLVRNGETISHINAKSANKALALLDEERSQPHGTAKALGIAAIPVRHALAMTKTVVVSRPSGWFDPNRHHPGVEEHISSTHAQIELSFPGEDQVFAVVTCDDNGQIVRSIRSDANLDPNKFNALVRALRSTPDKVLRMTCHRCQRNMGAKQ